MKPSGWTFLVSFIALAGVSAADPSAVATVGGRAISQEDMQQALKQQLYGVESQRYEIEKQWVDQRVDSLLLDQEAAARKLSREALEKKEITDKTTAVTESDIKKFYDQNKDQFRSAPDQKEPDALDKVKERIQDYLQKQNAAQRRSDYLAELRKKTPVTVRLVKPEPPKIAVSYGPQDPVLGDANAPVTILEFTDFQCPFCVRSQDTLHELLKKHPHDIKIVTRNYPLPFHNRARPLALAVLCAKEQGQYEPYREKVFGKTDLDDKALVEEAGKLKMDKAAFEKCFTTQKYGPQIDKDIAEASTFGVNGTPAFFINGYALSGAQPVENFEELIRKALAEKK